MAEPQRDIAKELRAVRLSKLDKADRRRLLDAYERNVYNPAFPNAEIREDPAYWLALLESDPYPPPPQPRLEVILILCEDDRVAGGATVEHYRDADCGLLTYLSVAANLRGQGLGRRLVGEASAALTDMAGGRKILFAETERLEDAIDEGERSATALRRAQLSALGGRLVDFDYWMPPLRPGLQTHRLDLISFEANIDSVSAEMVASLVRELAAALDADLQGNPQTAEMMSWLAERDRLALRQLQVADAGRTR